LNSYTLRKEQKILKSADFHKVYQSEKKLSGSFIVLYLAPTSFSKSRLGLSVNRKFGNSVQRNRFKRLIRESFRLNAPLLKQPCDIVIRPRSRALEATFKEIEADFCGLLSSYT